ncbi:MAG: xanthine dehydrogenase family protein molybdopterin-binding subunit, partial [Acidimicrobiaceae bacterium]|nr:xanthine dehydrogenase family protein molybdopterin-binding subunit [Acidimicrobiaceae bacterium]
ALGCWLSTSDGIVEIHAGKVELGQGILTALGQLAADALGLPLDRVRVVGAATGFGPDQGGTTGSHSVADSAPALTWVGGAVRHLTRYRNPGPSEIEDYISAIARLDPATDLTAISPESPLGPLSVGVSVPRVDLADKAYGRPRFLADLRPAGLLHGRVLRPASPGARLDAIAPGWTSPGVQLVRDGSFLGVIGDREADVDAALAALDKATTWHESDTLPDEFALPAWLRGGPHTDIELVDEAVGEPTHRASYSKPFLAHASIAPSCAMAQWNAEGDEVHIWSHSQSIYGLRLAVATALGLEPRRVTVAHVENAGCYGHNGADDAAFDAALLARAAPGRPVLVGWSRRDELTWGPLSPAMTATISARLSDGRIDGWSYDVWSTGHSARPGGNTPRLLAMAHLDGGTPLPAPGDPPPPSGGITRNALPYYNVGPRRVLGHRLTQTPLRTSAMRSLGAYFNVFAIESFIDELAMAVDADPVEFRLAHLDDPRASAVIKLAAERSGWGDSLPPDIGRGIAFARYKDSEAYCAVVAEVELTHELRLCRLVVAADIGRVVNPDGARNQLEGGAIQSSSWTVSERVRFDRRRILSDNWESYPIMRFPAVPTVDVHLIESDAPSVGAGEAAQGPTGGAIGNAISSALGVRVRDLPLDVSSIKTAIEAEEGTPP